MTKLSNDFQTITTEDKGTYTKFSVDTTDGVVIIVEGAENYYLLNTTRDNGENIEFARGWVCNESVDKASARIAREKMGITKYNNISILGKPVKLDNSWINQDIYFVIVNVKNLDNLFDIDVAAVNKYELSSFIAKTADSYSLMAYAKLLTR